MSSLARLESFRADYRRELVGARYRGWAHFALTSLTSLATIGVAAASLHHVRPLEWLAIPATFLVANLIEFLAHRGPMHHPRPGLGLLYKRHTLQHHQFFSHAQMTIASSRDFKIVLFPPPVVLFFLGGLAAPMGLLLGVCAGPNLAWLFVATAMAYYLSYEWLHLAYHAGAESFVSRLPLLSLLRHHHACHHDPRLMSRYNFNITFPICDSLFGTIAPSSIVEAGSTEEASEQMTSGDVDG